MDIVSTLELVTTEGAVYANRSALPRAWLVGDFELERPGHDTTSQEPAPAVLDRVVSPGFDPTATAIVSDTPEPTPRPDAVSGTVETVEEGYNGITLRVRTPADGLLVVSDVWYPHWEVTVDDQPATLLRANYALRAVAVPAGEHVVEFRYDDGSYRTGLVVSRLALVLVIVGFVAEPARRRFGRRSTAHGGKDA
mgnify:FL=1